MSFLLNVDGCSLEIPGLYSSLTFSTQSNALFASLFTKHANIPLQLFDDLLQLLRHPKFRTEEVTFQNPEDIIDHFSQQRRTIASLRSEKSQTATFCNPIPQIIVEHVAEHLDAQRTPFHRVFKKTYPECDADRSLRAMTLVHPSWTEPAQRCLRRRIFIKSLSGLRKTCEGTQLGPWVRELFCWRLGMSSPCSRTCVLDAIDASRLLCVVLEKCRNVRQLSITDFLPVPIHARCQERATLSDVPHRDVLHQLAQCRYVENLWLIQSVEPLAKGLEDLYLLLPCLTALKSLYLYGWGGWMSEQPNAIHSGNTKSLSPSLRALSLLHMVSPPFLAKTHDWYLPTTLEISMADVMRFELFHSLPLSEPMPLLQSIMSGIKKLCIRDCAAGDDVSKFTQRIPSLDTLVLHVTSYSTLPTVPLSLPPSTQNLHIHLLYIPVGGDQDTLALALLIASPQLRNFTITYPDFTGADGEGVERATFNATSEHCSHHNMEFELSEFDYSPSVLDL